MRCMLCKKVMVLDDAVVTNEGVVFCVGCVKGWGREIGEVGKRLIGDENGGENGGDLAEVV
jgi:hypothetical protein